MAMPGAALRARILWLGGVDPCRDRARSEKDNDSLGWWMRLGRMTHALRPAARTRAILSACDMCWGCRVTRGTPWGSTERSRLPRRPVPTPRLRALFDLNVFPEADPMIDLGHGGPRGPVGPRGAPPRPGALTDVVELPGGGARQITLRSGGRAEQVHADGVAWEVCVAADLARLFTLGDDLAVPYRFHGHHPLVLHYVRFGDSSFDKTTALAS